LIASICGCTPERADSDPPCHTRSISSTAVETEEPRARPAHLALACGVAASVEGDALTLRSPRGEVLLTDALVEGPIAAPQGDHIVWTEEAPTPGATMLRSSACKDGQWSPPITLADDRGRPDRIAFSPDGQRVAYVSASGGIAAIFAVDTSGGVPQQVTNVGVTRAGARPGKAPPGFVPVPHDRPLRFDGSLLRWQAADGSHQVVLP